MSHGGLLTGDIHGKLGSVVSFNKHGLDIQRGHKGWKNTSGSDAQWVRWLRLAICSKVWKWLHTRGLTTLTNIEFNKYNINIAPFLTYEEYNACECPSAPWVTSLENYHLKTKVLDIIIGRDVGFCPNIVYFPFLVGIDVLYVVNKLGMKSPDPQSTLAIRYSRPPNDIMHQTIFENIENKVWGIVGQDTVTSSYPSLRLWSSYTASSSMYVNKQSPTLAASYVYSPYDGYADFGIYFDEHSGETSYTYFSPNVGGGVAPLNVPSYFGLSLAISSDEIVTPYIEGHTSDFYYFSKFAFQGAATIERIDGRTFSYAYNMSFPYTEWTSSSKPVFFTLGGIATSYYPVPSEYSSKLTDESKQLAIASWRQHRINHM